MEIDGIISALIVGIVLGVLGRLLRPGKQDIPIWLTIVVGIVAAFLGSLLAGLVDEPVDLLALTRAPAAKSLPAGVGVRAVDFDAPATLRAALQGVDRLFLAQGSSLRQVDNEIALIDSAVAAGVKHIVRAEDVKPGAAVLDVGVTRETDPETGKSRVFGDVHPDVAEVAGFVSPNPGGVGPMTVALLMTNVVEAAERATAL